MPLGAYGVVTPIFGLTCSKAMLASAFKIVDPGLLSMTISFFQQLTHGHNYNALKQEWQPNFEVFGQKFD